MNCQKSLGVAPTTTHFTEEASSAPTPTCHATHPTVHRQAASAGCTELKVMSKRESSVHQDARYVRSRGIWPPRAAPSGTCPPWITNTAARPASNAIGAWDQEQLNLRDRHSPPACRPHSLAARRDTTQVHTCQDKELCESDLVCTAERASGPSTPSVQASLTV